MAKKLGKTKVLGADIHSVSLIYHLVGLDSLLHKKNNASWSFCGR